ncbi:hypothetical protein MIB92_01915 [Aestuariirhabdus sp. Z084]|uniref:hypothetical protein n=1 Tax=Aestuariirhabdus haliotis TaxID=2918751 RepID=UPI00201B3AB3|nr:hypothetical protein [Aestuariirhabdus haliotis]MCL6414395.1 hypothetical protein [Aestuariirhabdus haliotis]MCL6418327.1 hypothetical protein [Aestuariirhabdus haliotis]
MDQQEPQQTPKREALSFKGLLQPVHYEEYKSVPLHRNKYVALLASFAISPLVGLYLMYTGIFSNDEGKAKPAGWGVKGGILLLTAWLLFSVVTQSGFYRYGFLSVPQAPAIEQQQP